MKLLKIIILPLLSTISFTYFTCNNSEDSFMYVSNPTTSPNAPTGIMITNITSRQIKLSWTDNSDNETGFKIERAADNAGSPGSFSEVASVTQNSTTYTDAGLSPETTYYYRIYAYNIIGNSDYTDIVNATTNASSAGNQIIADHTVVDSYVDIPQEYIDEVKKMWLVIAGESHSEAYRDGLSNLAGSNSTYAANITESGTPESYTASNLRVSRGTWGDVDYETGWRYGYGEEDWFTSETAINRTKSGISYCYANSLTISAFGLGWCWDNGIDADAMTDYLTATVEYMDYCTANSIPTKIIFTTGPVDGYSGESAYNNYLRWQKVRDYVDTVPGAVLFDYADILCWDDDGVQTTSTYNAITFPTISPNSLEGSGTGHIGMNGAVRIAKAMWWMLARIAGWDGQ